VKVSFSIMAHPDRLGWVHALTKHLAIPDVPVSWDTEGPASGNADRVWRNARAAWEMREGDSDWHVLLQDDAVLCEDFAEGISEALRHVPGPAVVSPYLGNGRLVPERWTTLAASTDEVGASWIRTSKLMWGVSIAIPTLLIPDMIKHADTRAGVPDDMRVAGWAERNGIDVWYTWPSLIDHRQVPSLTKHRAHDRYAIRHHAGSAMEIDWSGPVITDPMLARRRIMRSKPSKRHSRSPV
jgi:hypothetical protein